MHPYAPPAKVRWWIAPLVAVPLGLFIVAFLLVLAWFWFFTIPLVFIAISVAVGISFVTSSSVPDARAVGVGVLLSIAPMMLLGAIALLGDFGTR